MMTPEQVSFKVACNELRNECLKVEHSVRNLTAEVGGLPEGSEHQEVNADLMLCVRHLEDARMRLGKAIQYGCEDGVSRFDKKSE